MDIEDIAKIDYFLKSQNGTQNILDVDDLIISDDKSNNIKDLQTAAFRLNKIESENNELYATWKNLFTKQVKFSVQLAKEKMQNQKTD